MRHRLEQRRQGGVTLLELIVAMTAAMILMSIAVPAYNGYATRVRVAVAIGDIGTISLQLYRWQLNTRSFPATLAEAGLDANDPWGNPYQYLPVAGAKRGDLRKDRNLVPINTDFDLYSMGPDGKSVGPLTAAASLDDVVRANDGSFIGVAKDY
jgi:general secretion pathway protein G